MQRAPREERLFSVTYGDDTLGFMLQPWFEVPSAPGEYDIVVTGIGAKDGADLGQALRAIDAARTLARPGGAVVVAARLEDGEGEVRAVDDGRFVVIAASEAPEIVRLAGLRAAVDVEEGLDLAYEHLGRPATASVLVVPRAPQLGSRLP